MRLYYNVTSPYTRKVRIVLHEKGLFDTTEQILVDPWADPAALHTAVPVGRVPALIADDGLVISESTTICDYLDSLPGGTPLIGKARWPVMARVALAQGIIDASFAIAIEARRPEALRSADTVARHKRAILRILASAEAATGRFDLGDISLAAALGYLDLRVKDVDWRKAQPDIAAWFAEAEKRPSMQATKPA
jgi:glutathione S-transferase